MNQKLDRRKKYTRMALKYSLITLLKIKPISTITVKEICERADINRSTFYTHYHDQFDLLEQIEEKMIADINTYLSQYNFTRDEESLQMTEKLLEYIAANYDICQTLLNENGDHSFERRVMDVARTFLVRNWTEKNNMDADLSEYAGTFLISGSIYVIKQWLANNMDKPPKQIAQLINSIELNG
ncbi:TetR/AcrR family transcriptional regulator [Lentibacillus cibarius]|uniref:TetR/AcrR family transcriptional regulator n=1 Tax=Lentibacillus cibarius TaxID=2583219 RepID=A0A549YGJ0_9BACI|nr:TetR-like C-terminal domain-containing protein [Lentibacillus cibarius]TRM10995.1 TetR/AcrR family transcriptional regulator [Lentibacillus cibarius]